MLEKDYFHWWPSVYIDNHALLNMKRLSSYIKDTTESSSVLLIGAKGQNQGDGGTIQEVQQVRLKSLSLL